MIHIFDGYEKVVKIDDSDFNTGPGLDFQRTRCLAMATGYKYGHVFIIACDGRPDAVFSCSRTNYIYFQRRLSNIVE